MSVSGLAFGFRTFRLPRRGYGLEECQDASAGDLERGRFAIADGAAESPHAALWARLLVDEFAHSGNGLPRWTNWLPSLQARWAAEVGRAAAAGVPWYLEPGLLQGAFATFLGLLIAENDWHALAVGDSCLFQVRQGELVRSFPMQHAADFGNAPWLVGSRTSPEEVPHKNGLRTQGGWLPGDRFWMMTDALAQWFLARVEMGETPWRTLDPILHYAGDENASRQAFAAWIENMRTARQLRNDDVTLLAISL